jgi:hypothetical protein
MLHQGSRLAAVADASCDLSLANDMETKMKTIMSALAASLLLAGAAAPASAETDVTEIVREYVKVPSSEQTREAKVRRYVPEQIEYQADKLPTGTSDWWRQMDREQRGGRR